MTADPDFTAPPYRVGGLLRLALEAETITDAEARRRIGVYYRQVRAAVERRQDFGRPLERVAEVFSVGAELSTSRAAAAAAAR